MGVLLIPMGLFAQKGQIKGNSESGKSEIKGNESPKSEVRDEPVRPQPVYSPPATEYSNPTYSEPSYSTPTPSRGETNPRSSGQESNGNNATQSNTLYEWEQPKPNPSEPKPKNVDRSNASSSSVNALNSGESLNPKGNPRTTQTSDGRTVIFDEAGPKGLRADPSLPGVRPDPLPLPPVVGTINPLSAPGNMGEFDEPRPDTVRPAGFSGAILYAPPKPQFSRDPLPPRPTLAQPSPKPNTNSGGSAASGGAYGSEYYPTESIDDLGIYQQGGFAGVGLPSALVCVYQSADQLEQRYLNPNWCTQYFVDDYRQRMATFSTCLAELPPHLEEPWMQSAYFTYYDEMNFWAEECANGDPVLKAIRDYLRAKAAFVPYLMPDVDAKLPEDWTYVDTAFAAPFGGYNYYRTVQAYEPQIVVRKTQEWIGRYDILLWPSYQRIAGLHHAYFRSGFWALLRAKALNDLQSAQNKMATDENAAYQFAENAGWISAAMLAIEPKEKDLLQLQTEIKTVLKSNSTRWNGHPLNKILN